MATTGIKLKGMRELKLTAEHLRGMDIKTFLERSARFFIASTMRGFITHQASPDGQKWAPNPSWWERTKGNTTPLTGITAGRGLTPDYLTGLYVKGNNRHMKNSLEYNVHAGQGYVVIFYHPDVEERAEANQYGLPGEMPLFTSEGKEVFRRTIKTQKREHMGIAYNWARGLGGKTDDEAIMSEMTQIVDKALGDA
jgi:hypothetical protein